MKSYNTYRVQCKTTIELPKELSNSVIIEKHSNYTDFKVDRSLCFCGLITMSLSDFLNSNYDNVKLVK